MDRGAWWAARLQQLSTRVHTVCCCPIILSLGLPCDSSVKNPPAVQETRVQPLGQEDDLEKGTATSLYIRLGFT